MKNGKTLLFASLLVVITLTLSVTSLADAQPNENANDKAKEMTAKEKVLNEKIDKIGKSVIELQIKNQALEHIPDNDKVRNENARDLELLFAELDRLAPPTPNVKFPKGLEKQMEDAKLRLWEFAPVYALGINHETGLLDVKVSSNENLDKQIQEIAGEKIPLNIEYGTNTFKLQAGSCSTTTGFCDPIIGGSDGHDKYYGKPCTVSIAVMRDNWPYADEKGIIIPDHCNPRTSDYYQTDTSKSSHKVGTQTKDGGWYCDCDFVKSDSRSIDTSKITVGSSDYTTSGNSDIADERWIFMYGSTSGFDAGKIKEVGQEWKDPNTEKKYKNLYKIQYISFTDGDSGAPVIDYYNGNYGGMNIGTDGTYQLAHEWSFLKSKLGLK